MNTFLLFAVPLTLLIIGMILNNLRLAYDQPESSPEQDPAKRASAERKAYRDYFDRQRSRSLTRQKRVGQYSWLVLVAFVVSFAWLYFDTVSQTTASNQIAALQTLATEEGKEMVLSVTLSDGRNVKYLIKLTRADASDAATKEIIWKEKISSWELSNARTALSIGDAELPLGIALNMSK